MFVSSGIQLLILLTLLQCLDIESFAPVPPVSENNKRRCTELFSSTRNQDGTTNSSSKKSSRRFVRRIKNKLKRVTSKNQFISVLDEAKSMLAISDMVYAYTGMRRLARESGDAALQTKLEFPQKSGVLVPIIWENLKLLDAKKNHQGTKSKEQLGSSENSEFIDDMVKRKEMWEVYLHEVSLCIF